MCPSGGHGDWGHCDTMGPTLKIPCTHWTRWKNTMKIFIIGHRDSLSYLTFSWESRIRWPRESGYEALTQDHMFSFTEIYEVPIFDLFNLKLNLVYDWTLTYCITWWIIFFARMVIHHYTWLAKGNMSLLWTYFLGNSTPVSIYQTK